MSANPLGDGVILAHFVSNADGLPRLEDMPSVRHRLAKEPTQAGLLIRVGSGFDGATKTICRDHVSRGDEKNKGLKCTCIECARSIEGLRSFCKRHIVLIIV